jgi:hypothetical protein
LATGNWQKKPTGINAVGLNPSLRRVEETGITIASFLAYRKFPFAIPAIIFVNNSILDVAIKKPAH